MCAKVLDSMRACQLRDMAAFCARLYVCYSPLLWSSLQSVRCSERREMMCAIISSDSLTMLSTASQ